MVNYGQCWGGICTLPLWPRLFIKRSNSLLCLLPPLHFHSLPLTAPVKRCKWECGEDPVSWRAGGPLAGEAVPGAPSSPPFTHLSFLYFCYPGGMAMPWIANLFSLGWALDTLISGLITRWLAPVYFTSLSSEQSENSISETATLFTANKILMFIWIKQDQGGLLNSELGITLRNQRDWVSTAWSYRRHSEVFPPKLWLVCNPTKDG